MNPRYFPAPLLALLLPVFAARAQATLTNDGGTLTLSSGATLYVAGTVQNNAAATLTNAGTVQLTGDLINAGTLTSSGTLLFSGTANQTFAPGTASVATLVLNNTGTSNRTLALPTDLTVGTALTLQSGLLRTAPTATLTLPDGATLSGEAPGQYVQGNLRILRGAGSGVLDFGHGATLDRTGLGSVSITRTAGLLTDNLSRGVNFNNTALQGIDRIWTVVPEVAPRAPVPITLQWLADDDNGLINFSQAQAWRADLSSAAWAAAGRPQAATSSGSTRSFSFETEALGRLTVSNLANPLPVELVRFTAEPLGADALLKWATASEKNNAYFEVEASADGRTFRRIGQVAGQGTTTQAHAYQLVDPAIAHYAANPVYYRLRQVDLNGTATYSPVRAVAVGPSALALFPNPTTQVATLTGAPANAVVTVLDAVGRVVLTTTTDTAGTALLHLPPTLAAGVYVVRAGSSSLRLTRAD